MLEPLEAGSAGTPMDGGHTGVRTRPPLLEFAMAKTVASRIGRHASVSYPNEACGFLLADDSPADLPTQTVIDALPAINAESARPSSAFRISAVESVRAERAAEGLGRRVVGFYHSHPDAPARPSPEDSLQAWPGHLHLIVSVGRTGVSDIRGFTVDERTLQPVPVRVGVVEGSGPPSDSDSEV
ncbi:MAG TPA: M67 family metallopeptidase [Thermoplasmata archaeon]|nr:M67 family metallopeptidase [Thermoplasmata archaeon]